MILRARRPIFSAMPTNLASQFHRLIRINVFPNILNDAMVVSPYLVTPEVSALEPDLIN